MPIPISIDALKREWVEVSSNNPKSVEKFRSCLITLLAFDHGHVPSIAGSGFIIGINGDYAFAITAKHVFKSALKIQRPHPRYAPSALQEFVPFSATSPSIDESKLRACWVGSGNAYMLLTRHISYNENLDIGCAVLEPQDENKKTFKPTSVLLDAKEPSVGDVVHMISLSGHEISNYFSPTDISGAGFPFLFNCHVSLRVGTVTGIYPQGYRQYKWPCFTTSIPAMPGMSGGMVTVRNRVPVGACGIVCADNSSDEARKDNALCGESVIALAWTALSINVPKVIDVNPPMQTLYEMMKLNQLPSAIGIDNVPYIDRGNGEGAIKIRRR